MYLLGIGWGKLRVHYKRYQTTLARFVWGELKSEL